MARFSATFENLTPAAVADNTNYTDAGYGALQGVSGKNMEVQELSISGLATTTTIDRLIFAFDGVAGATALSGGGISAMSQASVTNPTVFHTSTTKPKRGLAASAYLLLPQMNTFGGIYRWAVNPGDGVMLYSNVANTGEVSLSSISGVGPISFHILGAF